MSRPTAPEILQALVEGFDPFTGDELPPDTILQQAEVMRALLAGKAAIEAGAARAQRRSQLPANVGRPWTEEEELNLTHSFRDGDSLAELAQRHGRTPTAIEARLEKLGLVRPDERVTSNRFITSRGAAQRPKVPEDDEDVDELEDDEEADQEEDENEG